MTDEKLEPLLPPELGPGRQVGVESLRRTQSILAAKSFYLGVAIGLTMLVLVLLPSRRDSLVEFMRQAGLSGAIAVYVAAVVFWVLFLTKCRQSAAAGIPPKRGLKARHAWGLTTLLVWLVTWELLQTFTGSLISAGIAGLISVLGIWIGERLRQIENADDIRSRSYRRRIFDDSDQDNG